MHLKRFWLEAQKWMMVQIKNISSAECIIHIVRECNTIYTLVLVSPESEINAWLMLSTMRHSAFCARWKIALKMYKN